MLRALRELFYPPHKKPQYRVIRINRLCAYKQPHTSDALQAFAHSSLFNIVSFNSPARPGAGLPAPLFEHPAARPPPSPSFLGIPNTGPHHGNTTTKSLSQG